MMDLTLVCGIGLLIGAGLVCYGLSLISRSFDYAFVTTKGADHDKNPLYTYGSKYFYYRPKNSVLLTAKAWQNVEENMAYEIHARTRDSFEDGYNRCLKDLKGTVKEIEKDPDPYKLLGINRSDSITADEIDSVELNLRALFNPAKFEKFDADFVKLAEIKRDRIRKAAQRIRIERGLP